MHASRWSANKFMVELQVIVVPMGSGGFLCFKFVMWCICTALAPRAESASRWCMDSVCRGPLMPTSGGWQGFSLVP